jgi:hypothetical protein
MSRSVLTRRTAVRRRRARQQFMHPNAAQGRAQIREARVLCRSGRFAAITSGLDKGEPAIGPTSNRSAPARRSPT